MGPDSMNVLSGNNSNGIYIYRADSNVVTGNIIGLTAAGDMMLGNGRYGIEIANQATYNRIGGSTVKERNFISGNHFCGINIEGEGTDYNTMVGNFIGLGRDGLTDLGNGNQGILIQAGPCNNTIGGISFYERNCISGNEREGIRIYSPNTTHNHILGNYVGVDSSGTVAVGNGNQGVELSYQTSHNLISNNIISGNNSRGIQISGAYTDSNTVQGNWIGLDYTGQDTIPNKSSGMEISDFASYNLIGGPDYTDRNIVSGNEYIGIRIFNDSAAYNIIQNNFVGTDTSGTLALGNSGAGIYISGMKNVIKDNTVSANSQGIYVYNSCGGNSMHNNSVGVGADGITPLPNKSYGFLVAGKAVSDTIGPGNKIWYNQSWGIYMNGSDSQKVTITQNSISGNAFGGIMLNDSANAGIAAPVITGENPLTGTALPDCRIEVFSDTSEQGGIYEGYATADGSGNWTFTGDLSGPRVTATATDTEGNTSPFSSSMETSVKP
ncbi:MAG: NosD domain-containing protein, partial [bacterium]